MKLLRACVCICALSLVCGSLAQGAEWSSKYQQALDDARDAKRPLLVVFEQPSQPMERIAAEAESASSSLLEPYQLCRVNVTTKEGKALAKVYKATQFPYTVITDREGKNIIYRKSGQYTGLDWATMLVTYRTGTKPVKTAEAFQLSPSVCFT